MRVLAPILMISALLAAPAPLWADAKGNAILAKYDNKQNNFKDLTLKLLLKVKHPGRKNTKVIFKTITRPGGQRLIKMLYPGDIKGMHILVQSKSVMYIYLPAYRKVRRIAGHVRNQGFQGSGFTYDDMAIGKWTPYYDCNLMREDSRVWWIDCKAKPGKHPPYKHVKMAIRKDIELVETIQYFNRHGKKFKTQQFKKYKCRSDNSHCNPMLIRMIEHTRGNLVSEMKIHPRMLYNKGYPDRVFSVRHLYRAAN